VIDLSQFNGVDWVIIVVLTISTLFSLWRGFVREALSLLAWIAAFIVAHLFVDQLAAQLGGVIANMTGRYVAAYAILFVSTLVGFNVVIYLAAKLVRVTGLTVLDRVLGTVFGFARGVIIMLVLAYVVQQLAPPQDQQWLENSVLMPHLNMLADWVQATFANVNPGKQITT
jgi:membrane protein required for colicin V production